MCLAPIRSGTQVLDGFGSGKISGGLVVARHGRCDRKLMRTGKGIGLLPIELAFRAGKRARGSETRILVGSVPAGLRQLAKALASNADRGRLSLSHGLPLSETGTVPHER